ncbi:MAG: PKD domain-containing protein, partial [Chitinophagales bacterium]
GGSNIFCQDINISAYLAPIALFSFSGDPDVNFVDLSTETPTTWFWDFGDGDISSEQNPLHTYLANGTFNVCLTAANIVGENTFCQSLVIDSYLPPVTAFTYSGDPLVEFTDLTSGIPTEWFWDFGDGGTSTEMNPSHIYTANGNYNVCLTATNITGSDMHCEEITIDDNLPPVSIFSFTGDPVVMFTDLSTESPYAWSWDFGDGGSSTIQNSVHTYTLNGTYHVCLTASNFTGSNTACQDIIISSYLAPIAAFIYSGDPAVLFTDISINDPGAWSWDFGDGANSLMQNPTHAYDMNGTYDVCLTAASIYGSTTACQTIIIEGNPIPVAEFSYSGDPDVSFTDLSINSPSSWIWDFNDGSFSIDQNPEHTFAENGEYYVCLTVLNGGGSDIKCVNIGISGAQLLPYAGFTYTVAGSNNVIFADTSTNEPTDWYWEFGDGTISGLQNPTHTFPDAGSYNVCLTASNGAGENTYCKLIKLSVGLNEEHIKTLRVFPNPASEYIVIENCPLNNYNLDLFNSLGQKMEFNAASSNQNLIINTSALPAGNYFVKLESEGSIYTGRFVIEK